MSTALGLANPHRSPTRSFRILGVFACTLVLTGLIGGLGARTANAAPLALNQFCLNGSAPGQCTIPRGVATDPTTGDIYVADQNNGRIQQFTAWGALIRNWGSKGSSSGKFASPQGIALDSSGDVYVVDFNNSRVQKFDSEGHFLLMFGGEVDKTTNANVCTAASGDTCGAGVEGTANGFFGALVVGSYIAASPAGKIYVGDQNRIQIFDTNGAFVENIAQTGETAQSLAIDKDPNSPSYGDIYVTYFKGATESKANVQKLSPTGASLGTLEVGNPRALATDPSNGDVYVLDGHPAMGTPPPTVLRFSAAGKRLETIDAEDFRESTGLALNVPATCGLEGTDLIASSSQEAHSFVRIYQPPPDPTVCPPPEIAPSIDDQFVTSVGASDATVKAKINPHFWTETTRYHVEYGTGKCSEEGCSSKQPTPPGVLLAGPVTGGDLTTGSVLLANLAPDTAYHFRFVAESAGGGPTTGAEASFRTLPAASEPGPDSCPNAIFRNTSSAHLPDCRAYEMVSPVDKNGTDIFTNTTKSFRQESGELAVADEAGERMTFSSLRAFGGAEGASFSNQYLATRVGGSGWSTKAITAPRSPISFYVNGSSATLTNYKLFSEDLCSGWLLQDSPVALAPGAPDETGTLYRRELCGGGDFEVASSVKPPNFTFEAVNSRYFPEVQGASADGANTVFRADDALTPKACATPGIFQLYETLGSGGLQLVSVRPSESSTAGLPSCEQSSVGTAQGRYGDSRSDSTVGAVSDDGERIYWTTGGKESAVENPKAGSGDQPGMIYLRDNAREEESKHNSAGKCTQGTKACTYEVSGLVSPEAGPARFLVGSADGTRVLFSFGGIGKEELYEFEATQEKNGLGTAVTRIAKEFQGFMGASKDARRAYFVSNEVLATGATAGKDNLYFYEKGTPLTFVGKLSERDMIGSTITGAESEVPSAVSPMPSERTSRVSPDGLHAAFISAAPLTGFGNTDVESGEPDAEAFLYSAAAGGGEGKLVCASCNASGVRPSGRKLSNGSVTIGPVWAAAIIPGWPSQTRGGRALSSDGKRLFFTSFEPLVLRDTNGRTDVYEWEAVSSKEECLNQPANGGRGGELFLTEGSGCLSLISSGQSPQDSEFLDATPEGNDVFFATASSLVPQDPGLIDVYDARVDGGFAPPPAPKGACEAEACQSPPAPPAEQTPSSATYNGPGNLNAAKPCPAGKVKKKGKCVKKKSQHHKKGKANKNGRAAR